MKIYAYEETFDKACTIEIPAHFKDLYISNFGVASPSKLQVEKWLSNKNYQMKQRGTNNYVCVAIGD